MGIDTKPNFSSNKFEQCSGDTMNLSGCTQIFGTFDIESGATLSICNNIGVGKVLTSDASGNATWQEAGRSGTITGGTNGLSTVGSNIVLGGALTGDTTISGAYTLALTGDTNLSTYTGYQISGVTMLKTSTNAISSIYLIDGELITTGLTVSGNC